MAESHEAVPFAWLCRRCDLHSSDFSTREAAERSARRHDEESHPGATRTRVVILHAFARCQERRRRFAPICGRPASWAHPAVASDVHLCDEHRMVREELARARAM
jgi:hypothetical protein